MKKRRLDEKSDRRREERDHKGKMAKNKEEQERFMKEKRET